VSRPRSPETTDTIVALATPRGPGALGTVRLSGGKARRLARRLFRPWRHDPLFPPERVAVTGAALCPGRAGMGHTGRASRKREDEAIDSGVLIFFPARASPTGEDLVEVTLHGSPTVLDLFVRAAVGAGARPAFPGEFSYRAFLNGRLDAVQAEAVDDLVRARTEHQARAAYRQQSGALSRAVERPRGELVGWLARLEGSIEFSASEEEEFLDRKALLGGIAAIRESLDALLSQAGRGLALSRGARVVLAGPVNAGKSCLFNALVGSDRAIVSPHPGTTRDFIEAEIDWDGIPVTLVDTAGERIAASRDPVEEEGRRRSTAMQREADLILWLLDGSGAAAGAPPASVTGGPRRLSVVSKADAGWPLNPDAVASAADGAYLRVSARTGQGLAQLRARALEVLAPGWDRAEPPVVTRIRQESCLMEAVRALDEGAELARQGAGEELVVIPLQRSLERLAELTGRGGQEEIYHRIFASFCIGK
jgi:tRNA modification GTPase